MKLAIRTGLLVGVGVMIALILHGGAAQILDLLGRASWLLLWLVPLRTLPIALDAMGWSALLAGDSPFLRLFWIACIRDAINRLLPVASVGGEFVGVGLLARTGVDKARAAASVVVEILMTLVSQYLFVVIGVVCILYSSGAVPLTVNLAVGLAVSLPVIVLLIALLRYGAVFGPLQRIGARMLGGLTHPALAGAGSADIDEAVRSLSRAHPLLVRALLWQLGGLIAGSAETWFALRWLGAPVGIAEALALESLTQAVRSFIFLVPAGIGVQEVSLVEFGRVLGLAPDMALALSLAKRMREILFGVPVLIAWQWIEGRRGFAGQR